VKVYVTPGIKPRDKEWKLDDFQRDGKWRGIITADQLRAIDMMEMGGEYKVEPIPGKIITIIRIL